MQLQYTDKLDNLDKMNTFVGRHKLPILSQEEILNLSNPKTILKSKLVIKFSPTNKNLGPGSIIVSYNHLKP